MPTIGQEILRLILELRSPCRIVVIVTHDMDIATRADRVFELADGRLAKQDGGR
jgi:macrolide transport system ATP-binding/permease protein